MSSINKGLVIFIHGGSQAFAEEAEDNLADFGDDLSDGFFLGRSELTEHVGYDFIFLGLGRAFYCHRPPDAYPDTKEFLIPQVSNDRINPFVPAGTATLTDTDFAHRKVKVIVENY